MNLLFLTNCENRKRKGIALKAITSSNKEEEDDTETHLSKDEKKGANQKKRPKFKNNDAEENRIVC